MSEPPGQVDERACRILEDVVSSPGGRIELDEEDRSKLERYQAEFYYLLEKTGDLRFIESITGILDRISLLIPRMLSKALGLRIAGVDSASARRFWASINRRIDINLIDLHLRPLQVMSEKIYNRYHKFSKPIQEESIGSVTYDDARRDYLLLGEELRKLFDIEGLFLNPVDYQNLEIKEEPQLFTDEQITITERIQRFELYRDVLERDIGDLDLDTIIEITEAYWQRADKSKNDYSSSKELLRYAINRAEDQNIGGKLVEALYRLGDKHLVLGRASEAEELFSRALEEARKFGNDNVVAMLLTKLANSRICKSDSGLSAAQDELAEAEEIWILFGHKKNLLTTISVRVKLHIARSDYVAAREEIRTGVTLYENDFHPRSLWGFLDTCSKYLLDCPDKDMNSYGLKILDQAIALAKKHGELSKLIVSLSKKVNHSEGLKLATASSQLESLTELQERLDADIVNFAREFQGRPKETGEFVGKLLAHNYREGLRRASHLVPIEQFGGMEEDFESFEGDYGRYKSLDRQLKYLRNQVDLNGTDEMLEESDRFAERFGSDYFRTKNLEHRYFCAGNGAEVPKKERRKWLEHKEDLISQIISNWESLNSYNGVMRWKNHLALLLQRERGTPTGKRRAIELMREIQEFYRGKDAMRYAQYRFDYIQWTHDDENIDSALNTSPCRMTQPCRAIQS